MMRSRTYEVKGRTEVADGRGSAETTEVGTVKRLAIRAARSMVRMGLHTHAQVTMVRGCESFLLYQCHWSNEHNRVIVEEL